MNFTYANYQDSINKAQTSNTKIGFFKLSDGESAVVRFNVGSLDDLVFNSVHKAKFGETFKGLPGFSGISCLNPVGSYDSTCPLCAAASSGHPVVDKAKKLIFVQMMVAYRDKATGTWVAPAPVIWERPAGFSRELATKLQNYGDLRQRMFIVSRAGAGTDTRYTLDAIDRDNPVFKPDMVPADFSAFANFDLAKHSYWVKSVAELTDYITTGAFPEQPKATATNSVPTASSYAASIPTTGYSTAAAANTNPIVTPAVQQTVPTADSAPKANPTPTRNFSGFSF